MSTKKCLMLVLAVVILAAFAGCGSSSSTTPTSSLTMTMTESNSGALTSISKGVSVGKAFDFSTYSVQCDDGDSSTATVCANLDASGNVALTGLPTNMPVVCYLMSETNCGGTPITSLIVSDSTVLGSQYDAPKLSANSSVSVAFNSKAKGAVVTPDANLASNMSSSAAQDITGSYTMSCTGVYNEATDTAHASSATYCNNFAAGGNTSVYMHQISTTQGANTMYGAGAWRNQAAYTLCGSTEYINTLPTGMTLVDSTMANAFTWDSNFTGITSGSSQTITNAISTMIQNFGNANAATLGTSYSTFYSTGYNGSDVCQGERQLLSGGFVTSTEANNICAAKYYWMVVQSAINTNPSTWCIPQLQTNFTVANNIPSVTIQTMGTLGSSITPINRFQFAPLQFLTDSAGNTTGRMASKQFWPFNVMSMSGGGGQPTVTSLECVKMDALLIEWTMPTTVPVTGTQIIMKFTNQQYAAGIDAANDAACRAGGGGSSDESNTFGPNGYYMLVTMTKQ